MKITKLQETQVDGTNATLHIHYDCHPGLTMERAVVTEINNAHGQHYWKAVEQIGTLFGYEVDGEISAIGTTKEQCLARLAEERKKLHESLWV